MSELTRDDVFDIMLECDPHVCCKCALEPHRHECYEIKESALNSLRDDYNAEVEKSKRLTAELKQVKAERDINEKSYDDWYDKITAELAKVKAERDAATPENTVVVPRIGDTLYYITVWNTHQFEEKNQGKINAIKIFKNIIVVCIDNSCLEFDLKKQHMTWFLDREEWIRAGKIIFKMQKCISELSCQYCYNNTIHLVQDSLRCSNCGAKMDETEDKP